nr:GntR family transcriptional regulator [uncultured Sphaerochaeta sp.]
METKGSLKEMVYNQLVKDITSGIIKPNEILVEGSLIKRFQVSKAPVREALIELCKDNFLKSLPRVGYQVQACSLKEIIDILDFRVDLELCNLRRAFPYINEQSLKIFENYNIWKLEDDKDRNIAEHWLHNQKFHLLLCSLSKNSYAYRSLEQLLKQNARFFSQYYSYAYYHESESKGRYHASVINALKERNLEKACDLLTNDINAVKVQIQKVIQSDLS